MWCGRHAAALTNLGYLIYSVKKDYDEAERLYRRAVEAAPNDPAALNNLGLLLATARRDFAGAESMYERALKADPRCARAHSMLSADPLSAPRIPRSRATPPSQLCQATLAQCIAERIVCKAAYRVERRTGLAAS